MPWRTLKISQCPTSPIRVAGLGTIVWAGLAASLSGCSNSPLPEIDLSSTASKALAALPKPDLTLPINSFKPPVGTPTEIYTRVARGALTCWFGSHGPLKKTHRFHAQADPPSKGGHSRITIYKIPKDKTRSLGDRAFAIQIVPDGTSAKLLIENLSLPKVQVDRYSADAARWAANDEGCFKSEDIAKDWSAQPGSGVEKAAKGKK